MAITQNWQPASSTFYEDATIPLQNLQSAHRPRITEDSEWQAQHRNALPQIPPRPTRSTRPLPQVSATPRPHPAQSEQATAAQSEKLLPGKYSLFRAYRSEATPATMKRLERRERIVFALLDGGRAIQDVARLTHQSDLAVARIIVRLYHQGYIEYIQG
ncbi:MAG TPA: hypothetical protein VGT44_06580 [Ktedonobacteraceae bacterium]|nr:hypothetical protein [Ktedonobacteraceae bacterium]